MARIVLEHLTKIFTGPNSKAVRALDDLTLTIESGEFLVLVGPSGCGKTTTLRLLAGLEAPTTGTISIDGEVVNDLAPKARDVAMVFQNPALYPHLSVRENLAFGLKVRKFARSEIQTRVEETAAWLGLSGYLEHRPMALSGGQRQRVALGRALVRRPRLLLLDEPLSNLDAPLRAQTRAEIGRMHQRLGATFLYVTHDQTEAMSLGGRLGILHHGQLQQIGAPLALYRHPANRFVAGFLGVPGMNFFAGTLRATDQGAWFHAPSPSGPAAEGGLVLPLGRELATRLGSYSGKALTLAIRPEHVAPALPGDASLSPRIPAVVEGVEPLGAETHLRLQAGGLPFAARVSGDFTARTGEKMTVAFDLGQAHFFDPVTEESILRRE